MNRCCFGCGYLRLKQHLYLLSGGRKAMWKKISFYRKCIIGILCVIIILNLAALSQEFCDWYVTHIFPLGVATYGRFSGLFPFSLGEYMMIAGIILLIVALVCGGWLILFRKKENHINFYANYKKGIVKYYKICLIILMVVALLFTLNFSILYHCSPMKVNDEVKTRKYSVRELEILRNYLVEHINALSGQIERDGENQALYRGDTRQEAKRAMSTLAEKYPRFSGYYPDAKPIRCSRIMSMTGIAGVYFAFSLEANYNDEMYSTVYPETICHEYAHLKGYIFEDEANFWGYLACVESDDSFFQYSGYMGALDYVEEAYSESVDRERYDSQIKLNELAEADWYVWLDKETREEIYDEETAAVTESMTEAREVVHDVSLKMSGVQDGVASYGRVTELLLQYYDGRLY